MPRPFIDSHTVVNFLTNLSLLLLLRRPEVPVLPLQPRDGAGLAREGPPEHAAVAVPVEVLLHPVDVVAHEHEKDVLRRNVLVQDFINYFESRMLGVSVLILNTMLFFIM